MDTIKNVAAIVAYAATGAIVGKIIDSLAQRVFDAFEWDGPAVRAGVQGALGIAALANVAQSVGANIMIPDPTGPISGMWFFFFSAQKNMMKDVEMIATQFTTMGQHILAPRVSEESIIKMGEGGQDINSRSSAQLQETQQILRGDVE